MTATLLAVTVVCDRLNWDDAILAAAGAFGAALAVLVVGAWAIRH